jgi:hypothetical protein
MYSSLRFGSCHSGGVSADAIAKHGMAERVFEGGRGVETISTAVTVEERYVLRLPCYLLGEESATVVNTDRAQC